ncbi:hypothetical protein [Cellulomonas dongxiuzhuiae]|uniref:Glycosyltransferase n=1 Tax=Cellulomonas dongxiuzhuiae TaxID=2819979 RepID=A0ABX8GLJ8_9CELL|nr:hypothetical protein [Cellulomonas dongxiuzhuiae]MBO3096362.1 hypothetical protein [Cellulomonas dongxiuzhuiae]QWC16775.1 hypothetical protein KKR89_03775 [Cellulomonas dongxiuzhuiae]
MTQKRPFVAAVVTYGARTEMALRLLERLCAEDVGGLILVLNGSALAADDARRVVDQRLAVHTEVVDLGANGGSARGFAGAIATARAKFAGVDLLLLDDDAVIENGMMGEYRRHAHDLGVMTGGLFAFAPFNPSNEPQAKVVSDGVPAPRAFAVVRPGWFEGFDIRDRIKWAQRESSRTNMAAGLDGRGLEARWLSIPVAPYGGLYLSAHAVATGVSPNPDLVLYFDDYDFTLRLREAGVGLYLQAALRMTTLEDGRKAAGPSSFTGRAVSTPRREEWRVLYRVRNTAYVQRRIAGSAGVRARFAVNLLIRSAAYLAYGFALGRPAAGIRAVAAISAGLRGRLGPSYSLPGLAYDLED